MPALTILSQTLPYLATITNYNGSTKVATLGAPPGYTGTWPGVNLSLGTSLSQGALSSTYSINGTYVNIAQATAANGVATLSTDESGNFVGIFNMPAGVFHTGSRVFRIDNRTISADPSTATSYAQATFTAGALLTNIGAADIQPSVDSSATTFTPISQQSSQMLNNPNGLYDPLAQCFTISKNVYPNGVFLNSIKLFFAKVPGDSAIPVTVSIVPTVNGYPNGQTLSYSTISLTPPAVKANSTPYFTDPNTYTQFTFDAPVYVQSGVTYAIMVESSSVDYQLWFAQQNQNSISSTSEGQSSKIGTAPYIGGLFEPQNIHSWAADVTRSLMFIIDQCVFNTNVTPQIEFVVPKNLPFRKLGTNDVLYRVSANSVSNLRNIYSKQMKMDAFNVSTTDFSPTDTGINYTYNATLLDGTKTPASPINPGTYGTPMADHVYLADNKGERALFAGSNSSFILNATLSSKDKNVSPIIADDGVSLYAVRYYINNMGIGNNVISIANAGLGYNVQTAGVIVTSGLSNSTSSSDTGGALPAFGITANSTTGAITSVYTTSTGAGYLVSPTIVISDPTTRTANGNVTTSTGSNVVTGNGTSFTTQLLVGGALTTTSNIVLGTIQTITNTKSIILTSNAAASVSANNYFVANASIKIYGEDGSSGGNAYAKYFTKKVVLAPGQSAGDLRVFYTAYLPLGSQIYVYYKVLSAQDTSTFKSAGWQLMTTVSGQNLYSTSRTNLNEYECAPGVYNSNVANNTPIVYTNATGQTFNSFTQFAIKVVLATSDNTIVPFLTDIRALALPPGTGL